jgi:hypothetical protein
MNNPGIKEEIWLALRKKWDGLVADGHKLKVEFNILTGPADPQTLAIDVAQNIDGEWFVQTVQRQVKEAHQMLGIEGMELDQLINLTDRVVDSVTEPITGRKTYDDEMHIFMKRISPETSEIHGHVISKKGEKIGIRASYRHYYVINEILEQISRIMKEEYTEIQLHRNKDDNGRIYYRFVHAE